MGPREYEVKVEGRGNGLPSGRRQRVGPISMQLEEGARVELPAVGEKTFYVHLRCGCMAVDR